MGSDAFQRTDNDRPAHPTDREHKAVFEHLVMWEERSLLTHEQVDAIRAYETEGRATAPRVPLITEVVAYVGAALALGAVVALVGPRWEEISHGQKLLGSALLAVALVGAGAVLRAMTEPAVRRLAGVVWTLGLGSMTGFLALLLFDLAPGQDPAPWAVFVLGMAVDCRPCDADAAAVHPVVDRAIRRHGDGGDWRRRVGRRGGLGRGSTISSGGRRSRASWLPCRSWSPGLRAC